MVTVHISEIQVGRFSEIQVEKKNRIDEQLIWISNDFGLILVHVSRINPTNSALNSSVSINIRVQVKEAWLR